MKKCSWLTLLALVCCCLCQAQQNTDTPDSAGQTVTPHAGSLFAAFTASVKESNKVVLNWDIDSAGEGNYFIIERGQDGSRYQTIGAIRATDGNFHYELIDAAPPAGINFYRIKYAESAGSPTYSKAIQLSLSGTIDFKFYPNPADRLFIVRTEHSIDLQILDASGAVRLSKRLQSGIEVIDVSSLERGVYVLRVTDKESNRAISRQLLKN